MPCAMFIVAIFGQNILKQIDARFILEHFQCAFDAKPIKGLGKCTNTFCELFRV
jgi:hypothetical protein